MPYFTLLCSMFSIQAGAALAKRIFPLLGAQGVTLLRLCFAASILCILWRPWREKLTAKELRTAVRYGVSLSAMNLLFYLSIERIPIGIAVAVEFTGPLALALFSSRRLLDFLWALLAALGIALLAPKNAGHGILATHSLDPIGVVFALSAGVFWALYVLTGRTASTTLKGGIATSLGIGTGALLMLPYGAVSAGAKIISHPEALPAAIGVALLSSVIPYSLDMFTLKRIPPKTFSILLSLAPALAALSGWFFLKESLLFIQWIAILCVVMASIGVTVSRKSA